MMYGDNMMMGWGGMLFGLLIMVGFLVLIVVAIVALVKWAGSNGASDGTPDRAMSILNERFAAGEIDTAEFEDRKRQLQA